MSNDVILPKHVAIIMDGNRRWAQKRGLPVVAGHAYVIEELLERLIEHAAEKGIEYLTLWAFSTENWSRAEDEVSGILKLFRWALEKKAKKLIEQGACVRMIGDLSRFPADIRDGFESLMTSSQHNAKITVTFALNYGGRDEIVRAAQKIMQSSQGAQQTDKKDALFSHPLSNTQLTTLLSESLDTVGMPDPDLIIRPGGEKRLSGFMLWQSEYSELYFTDVLMPDFDEGEFDKALDEFAFRERRKGR